MSESCSPFQNFCKTKCDRTVLPSYLHLSPAVSTIFNSRKRSISLNGALNAITANSSNSIVSKNVATASTPSAPINRRNATTQQRLIELHEFVQLNGHAEVPYAHPGGLGRWAAEQRHRWRRGRLATPLYRSLASLGFSFDSFDSRWVARFRQLAAFHSKHGHCHIPHDDPSVAPGLYPWTLVQRQRRRQGRLDDARTRRLDGIGFPWDVQAARIDDRIAELESFVASHGHAEVPRDWYENPNLASWVDAIRLKWRDKQLDGLAPSQQAKLRALGVEPAPSVSKQLGWDGRVAQLKGVRSRKGNLVGRLPNTGASIGLGDWAARQRALWRDGKISIEKESELEALGFEWDPEEAAWQRGLSAVDKYIEARGMATAYLHLVLLGRETLFRQRRGGAGGGLGHEDWEPGRWVNSARKAAKQGKLSEIQAAALAERGLLPGESLNFKVDEETE